MRGGRGLEMGKRKGGKVKGREGKVRGREGDG